MLAEQRYNHYFMFFVTHLAVGNYIINVLKISVQYDDPSFKKRIKID